MKIEIISIGDEVVAGYTINSNAAYIAQKLLQAGFIVSQHIAIGDDPQNITELLQERLKKAQLIITTGGLGPTCDDHTCKVLADLFHFPLVFNEEIEKEIIVRFGNRTTAAVNRNQATVPQGAQILPNSLGTASGLLFRNDALFPGVELIALPGVPAEMRAMVEEQVVPFIKRKKISGLMPFVLPLHFMRLTESMVDPLLRDIEERYPEIQCGIYPTYGTVTVQLKSSAVNYDDFLLKISKPREELLREFSEFHFSSSSGTLQEALHNVLIEKKVSVATAESCTGGALAARFVAQANASRYFQGSIIAYSNDVKCKFLRVDPKVLEEFGAVSTQVTEQMAQHVAEDMNALCGIGVSGIFGPTGGTELKPVGTVCASIALRGEPIHSWTMQFRGNREVIMERTIQNILSEIFLYLRLCKIF